MRSLNHWKFNAIPFSIPALLFFFVLQSEVNAINTARTRKQAILTKDEKSEILTFDNIKIEKGKLRMVRIKITGTDLTLRKINAKKEKIYDIFQVMVIQNTKEQIHSSKFQESLEKDFQKAIERVVKDSTIHSLEIINL